MKVFQFLANIWLQLLFYLFCSHILYLHYAKILLENTFPIRVLFFRICFFVSFQRIKMQQANNLEVNETEKSVKLLKTCPLNHPQDMQTDSSGNWKDFRKTFQTACEHVLISIQFGLPLLNYCKNSSLFCCCHLL